MILRMAIGIIWRGSPAREVLVARRLDTARHAPGRAEFPGGKIEPGESPQDCAAREILEETGLQVRVGAAYAVVDFDGPDRRIEMHAFDCEVLAGVPRALQSASITWVPLSELAPDDFPPANASLIREIHDRHGS